MVLSCCAYGCTERSRKESMISFHQFPADPDLRKQWVLATKRKDFVPSKRAVLCSKHFRVSDFLVYTGKRRLEQNAVPSIFNFTPHLKKGLKQRKSRRSVCALHQEESDADEKLQPVASTSQTGATDPGKRKRLSEYSEEDLSNPKVAKVIWRTALEAVKLKNKEIKYLQSKNRRLQKRIVSLKNLLIHLKQAKKISND